ncbi:hypothetical protein [Kordia sp.]
MNTQPYLQKQFARIGRVIPKAIYNNAQVSILITSNNNENMVRE